MLAIIIAATLVISMVSLIGALLVFRKKIENETLRPLISLAAGSLLAVAFLDLLPEAIEEGSFAPHAILAATFGSMVVFFLFERVLHWHHCRDAYHAHNHDHEKGNLVYLNLFGDALHNFIDGVLVASAFLLSFESGIIVALAVLLHEIPQELSDFGILLYAGMSKARAVLYNLLVALTALIGAVLFYFFGSAFEATIPFVVSVTAGNFIYLATADLIPELYHENRQEKVIQYSFWLLFGVAIIYLAGLVVPHG